MLFLGKAEMLLSHGRLFTPIDLKRRIFRRAARPAPPPGAAAAEAGAVRSTAWSGSTSCATRRSRPARSLSSCSPRTARWRSPTGSRSRCSGSRPATSGGRSATSICRTGRWSCASTSSRPSSSGARCGCTTCRVNRPHGEVIHLEIQISPLTGSDASLLGVNLTFQDVTTARRLQEELERTNQQLEAAYEELQSTNEELETTNEELQSTVEELETTNEELQSTNEELETMNEELQSTNDELQTINDQLHLSTAQLDDANAFLETVLTSLRAGVAVVDRDLRVRSWNRRAEDLWGLRAAEVIGQHFLNLDIGLPFEQLRSVLRAASAPDGAAGEVTLSAVNRRGRTITVRVACTPLRTQRQADPAQGAIVVMESGDEIRPETGV